MINQNQHIIPKAYLKYFVTSNFVYLIHLNNNYKTKIQREGIGHRIFCDYEKKYYNFPNRNNEPILEKMFQKIESTDYENINYRIESKQNISYETKLLIIEWLLMMKTRNSFLRDNFSRVSAFIEKTKFGLTHGNEGMNKKAEEFEKLGKEIGKAFQLSCFLTPKNYTDLIKSYSINFLNRHWIILESPASDFITSDNPGFSISFSQDIISLRLSPLSSTYNLSNSVNSIHYFPMSSERCLCLYPILEGDLPEITKGEMEKIIFKDILYKKASEDDVEKINFCTSETAHKLIISKKAESLNSYIETVKGK